MSRVAAVVLGGGSARRYGTDKLEAPLGRGRLLDRALESALAACDGPVVLVGPPRDALPPRVRVVREDPPGTGPVAALAAGLAAVDAPVGDDRATDDRPTDDARVLLVLAGDLLDPSDAVPVLLATLEREPAADGALVVDVDGRRQPLLAAYRVPALRAALGAAPAAGRSVRDLVAGLAVVEVPDGGGWSRDVDRPEDLSPTS